MPICRPKHQKLIRKCYPKKLPKDQIDAKPNSSELSYLIYYATTRRTKLQKIGNYLDRKSDEDISKKRFSSLVITLQIYTALIIKSPKDLPLYVRHVITLLLDVLRTRDLDLIEASLPTLEAFCQAHDGRNLSADLAYLGHYERMVQSYAQLASSPPKSGSGGSKSLDLRWRIAGLKAVKAIAGSEALSIETGRQLGMIIPVMLQNLHADRADHLINIQKRDKADQDKESEKASRPRPSFSTNRTTESAPEKSGTASSTTAEADLVDELDIGVLALRALRRVFEVPNRGQTRNATMILVHFIAQNRRPSSSFSKRGSDWGSSLMETITQWVPVQDRFVVLLATVQALVKNPPSEEHQLILARLVDWLLCSKMNLIGLSVMDVLVDLVHHMHRLLRSGPSRSGSLSKEAAVKIEKAKDEQRVAGGQPTLSLKLEDSPNDSSPAPLSNTRILVIQQIKTCLGSLGTHIYYAEQIPDMITRLLNHVRFEDLTTSSTSGSPEEKATTSLPDFSKPQDKALPGLPTAQNSFTLDERVLVLEAIKEILIISNSRTSAQGSETVNRNRVALQNWEGSEVLLENDSFPVRLAYVDALVTWLRQEVGKGGWTHMHERSPPTKGVSVSNSHSGDLQKQMFSAAASKERSLRRKGRFLQLLHISIYDTTLRFVRSEYDMLLIHLLLHNLVEWLSVLEISVGLPMILQLQDDIRGLSDPGSQARLGSLVHGYLLSIVEKFSFGYSSVGREIQLEVTKRRERKAWCDRIRIPPLQADGIATLVEDETRAQTFDRTPVLRPFDSKTAFVDQLATSFTAASPHSSPPTTPSRNFARPIVASPVPSADSQELPSDLRSEMQSVWSKESLLTSIADEQRGSRKTSINSRNGGSTTNLAELGKMSKDTNGHANGSIGLSQRLRQIQHGRDGRDNSPTRWSDSSRSSTLRVEDLKRIQAGSAAPIARPASSRGHLLPSQQDSVQPVHSSDNVSSLQPSSEESRERPKGAYAVSHDVTPPSGLAIKHENPEPPSSRDSEPMAIDLSSFAGGPPELSTPKPRPTTTDTSKPASPPSSAATTDPADLFRPSQASRSTSASHSYQAPLGPSPSTPLANSASLPGAFPKSPAPTGHIPRSSRDHVGGFVFRNSYFEASPRIGTANRPSQESTNAPAPTIDMSDHQVVPDEDERAPIGRALSPEIPKAAVGRAISPDIPNVRRTISPEMQKRPSQEARAITPTPVRQSSQSNISTGLRPRTSDGASQQSAMNNVKPAQSQPLPTPLIQSSPPPAKLPSAHPLQPPPVPMPAVPAVPRSRNRSSSGAPRERLARSRSRGRGDRSGITSGLGQMGAGDVKAFLSLIDVDEERPKTGVARPPY